MANKVNVIPPKAREILDAITGEFGIEVIEDYIKLYKRRQRKRMKRHNTKEEVAYDVYKLMYEEGYSRSRAINKIEAERHISDKTINNHLNNFNQEAKKNNFYTFGYIIDRMYYNSNNFNQFYCMGGYYYVNEAIELLARENDLEKEVLETYYFRYKTLPKKEKAKYNLDFNNIKIPEEIKCVIPDEYLQIDETQQNKETSTPANENEAPDIDIDIDPDDIPF
jgi:ribosomal protein L22